MAGQVTTSVLSKLGARGQQAWNKVRGNAVTTGNARLPSGIENGICQLKEIGFKETEKGKPNAGKPYFLARGVLVVPSHKDGMKISGRQTMKYVLIADIADKQKTLEDQLDQARNILGQFGIKTEGVEWGAIDAACALLTKQQPYFGLRTWSGNKQVMEQVGNQFWAVQGKNRKGPYPSAEQCKKMNPYLDKDPLVNEEWLGLVEYTATTDPTAGVQDDTGTDELMGTEPSVNGEAHGSGDMEDGDELDQLLLKASADDTDAQSELLNLAEQLGVKEEAEKDENGWDDVVRIIREAQEVQSSHPGTDDEPTANPEPEPAPEPPAEPEKGQVVKYKPTVKDPKGKPYAKVVPCEVVTVGKKTKTVDLKVVSNGQVVKGVKWVDLE